MEIPAESCERTTLLAMPAPRLGVFSAIKLNPAIPHFLFYTDVSLKVNCKPKRDIKTDLFYKQSNR